jgi:hypothetical protein
MFPATRSAAQTPNASRTGVDSIGAEIVGYGRTASFLFGDLTVGRTLGLSGGGKMTVRVSPPSGGAPAVMAAWWVMAMA